MPLHKCPSFGIAVDPEISMDRMCVTIIIWNWVQISENEIKSQQFTHRIKRIMQHLL